MRFTAWFDDDERTAIQTAADALGSSENHVIRMGVRLLLGLDKPNAVTSQLSQLSQVTTKEIE